MQTDSAKLNSALQDFFVTCLKEIYWSEINLRATLATMTEEASTTQLKEAFKKHGDETEKHARVVENVFALFGLPAEQEPSVGLQGLFDEGWQVIDETEKGSAQRDVALIIAAQKVEHYEIATYGSLVSLAKSLGHREVIELLVPVLEEEKVTDQLLTTIAEAGINDDATQERAALQNEVLP